VPWNVKRSAQFIEKEILKFGEPGLGAIKSVVLDSTAFAMPADPNARNVVPAGTILTQSAVAPTKYVQYTGGGTIKGILAHSVEILVNATAGDEPAPMFFHECVFATEAIVGFTTHAAALVTALKTCLFE
jgi:hypothetical protein